MGKYKKVTEKKEPFNVSTNGVEIVKELMKQYGITTAYIANEAGFTSRQALYQCFKNESLNLSSFYKLLKAMNYRIVVEPDMGDIGVGAYCVEGTVIEKDSDSE